MKCSMNETAKSAAKSAANCAANCSTHFSNSSLLHSVMAFAIVVSTTLTVLLGSGRFAMAADGFDPYAPVSAFSVDLRSPKHELRDMSEVSDEQHQQFSQLAVLQARVWSDTILEGDFEAAGDTRVDRIQGVYSAGSLLAYRVTFSESAWSTTDCKYNAADKSTLVACAPGRIVESMYVTPDLKSSERDERNFAHFVN